MSGAGRAGAGSDPVAEPRARSEIMIAAIARMLEGLDHVAVGASSPVPGSAALLARELSGGRLRVSLLGSRRHNPFTSGGPELFDCAAQGRIDAFFLSGVEIDGAANINLLGLGDPPGSRARFSGSFGSAFLYHVVPRVILFREEHSPRTLVETVSFVSAAGSSPAHHYRPGGPHALVTGLCVLAFDTVSRRFRLASTHPGVTTEAVRAATGFSFDMPGHVPETAPLDPDGLRLLRSIVARQVAETYPAFARRTWGIDA